MKKQLLTLLVLLFSYVHLSAQTIDIATIDLTSPISLAIKGTDLYIAEYTGNRVSKVDLTENDPMPVDILTGITKPTALLMDGNDLYVSLKTVGKVVKIDITDVNPTVVDVATGLNEPNGLAISGNTLYISQSGADKVSSIDLSNASANVMDVATGFDQPKGLAIYGDDLFIADYGNDKVIKVNLSDINSGPIDIVTEIDYIYSLHVNNNDLFIGNNNSVYVIDLSLPSLSKELLLTDLDGVKGLVSDEGGLYIGEQSIGKIIKYGERITGLSSENEAGELLVYPNRSTEYIQVSGLKTQSPYTIYNQQGTVVSSGIISNNEQIEILEFTNGMFYLALPNLKVLKFVKL